MLYLSMLVLNERNVEVQRDLADCNRLHRRIMRAFPNLEANGNAREQLGILYRLESPEESGSWRLLIQSIQPGNWAALEGAYLLRPPDQKRIDDAYSHIATGMTLRFRLRVNPTKRVDRKDDTRWLGRRVALHTEDEQIAWLERKGAQHGFRLLPVPSGKIVDVRAGFEPDVKGRRRATVGGPAVQPDTRLVFGSALFEGFLSVEDAALFQLTLQQGIGSGKAYGFGLLSVARVRPE